MTEQQKESPEQKKASNFAMAIAASQMGFMVIAGLFGGLWLDRKWGTMPWLGFAGLILGFISGIQVLIRLVRSNRS